MKYPGLASIRVDRRRWVNAEDLLDRLRRMKADGAPIDDLINELEEECS